MNSEQESNDRLELRGWGSLNLKSIFLKDGVVHRQPEAWATTVHSLLRHFESIGFSGAPRVVGTGFDADGFETVTFIEGNFMQPGPWKLEGVEAVGCLLRSVHDATASFKSPSDAVWKPWFGREMGTQACVVGHCDAGPWNIVARGDMPVAFIDWDFAGPVDPIVDLAQASWLNAKLYSDDVAEREGLPSLADRARQLRAIVDGYGLTAVQRRGFVNLIIELAVHSVAAEADEYNIRPDTTSSVGIWGIAWRGRSASWMIRHRSTLQNALA